MKLFTYIRRNVTRNKLRSSLTILSVAFSLALMTILYGYLAMQNVIQREGSKSDRLVVLNKLGFAGPLPIAHVERIRRLDSIQAAIPFGFFGGNHMGEQMPFAQFSTDPKYAFEVFDDYQISSEELTAFQQDRQGCVADKRLAEQMEWEVGDKIPLEGTYMPCDLDLRLVGIFEAPGNTGAIWFNWEYLDEELKTALPTFAGNAGMIYAKCKVNGENAIVSEQIDAIFANSENATRSRTEGAFAMMFAEMLGDVQTYIRFISLAVVFALALVAATTMAMSMRERTTEVAVLKAIGFSKQRILSLVLGESTIIAILGGLLGIAGGLGVLHLISQIPAATMLFPVPVTALAGPWILGLVSVAAAIGLVSGLVPAVLAAQLSVVDGLRRVV